MNTRKAALIIACGLLPLVGRASAAPAVPAADKTFMTKAAEGGNGEVALGKLASQRGSRPIVKQFGQRMVTDHSKANAELMKIAAQQNVSLPQGIAPEDKPLMAKLSGLSGPAFDKAYATAMVKDHQEDIKDFTKEARNGKDRATAQFAAKTLPTLQMHLQMAQQMAGQTRAAKPTKTP